MNKREFLFAAGATAAIGAAMPLRAQERDFEAARDEWRSLLPDSFAAPLPSTRLDLTEAEWRERLDPLAYRVLRKEATETAFTSPLNNEKRDGVFVCKGCDLPLFTSAMKYDSGTGWPSFFTTIPDVFETKRDWVLLLPRTEYHCVRCGGHHGHVFNDGPPPTNERWCNNGAALRFVPAA